MPNITFTSISRGGLKKERSYGVVVGVRVGKGKWCAMNRVQMGAGYRVCVLYVGSISVDA